MTELSRPPLDKAFVVDSLKTVMSRLRAAELCLSGLKREQAISEHDHEALEGVLSAAHCEIGELYLALSKEEEESRRD
ncbi:MAG: hypothetical protein ACR652_15015 [Methylocystis sp.]|uniref:hypothetical protein n=1 Tax=Methylocystis sp. TaxID=1911079 RepID=UPI003DA42B3F